MEAAEVTLEAEKICVMVCPEGALYLRRMLF